MGITKHGFTANRSKAPEYRAWLYITELCTNPCFKHYGEVGGRGISLDPAWLDFKTFYKDMGKRPSPNYVLARISEDEDFTKDNCVWALPQQRKSDIAALARRHNLPPNTLRCRIKMGWPLEEALNTPVRAYRLY